MGKLNTHSIKGVKGTSVSAPKDPKDLLPSPKAYSLASKEQVFGTRILC